MYIRLCIVAVLSFLNLSCQSDYVLVPIECPHPSLNCQTDGGSLSVLPPDTGQIPLDLEPDINVTPVNYHFGDIESGCLETADIKIENLGGADLIISQIYFSSTADLSANTSSIAYPIAIGPLGHITITINFEPLDELPDLSFLTIDSNDPDEPSVSVTQRGEEHRYGTATDSWVQSEITKTDILFVVDNSGSMRQEQSDLSAHAHDFINALDSLGADYQIAVITTDSEYFVGPVIDSYSPTRVTDLSTQISVGTSGDTVEKGLFYAQQATLSGGDATPSSGFIRSDSILNIIFVSDENDWSGGLVSTYTNHFRSLKTDPTHVLLHAVVGDVPSGCSTAQPGTRYVDAKNVTGGLFYSICSADWGLNLQNLANGATTARTTFTLSDIPINTNIDVYVDGSPQLTGWSYDPVQNAIVFDTTSIPHSGSIIDAEYGIYGDCT